MLIVRPSGPYCAEPLGQLLPVAPGMFLFPPVGPAGGGQALPPYFGPTMPVPPPGYPTGPRHTTPPPPFVPRGAPTPPPSCVVLPALPPCPSGAWVLVYGADDLPRSVCCRK